MLFILKGNIGCINANFSKLLLILNDICSLVIYISGVLSFSEYTFFHNGYDFVFIEWFIKPYFS